MQGNRTSEQQGKLCPTHRARASAPGQVLRTETVTRASAHHPQPPRLLDPYNLPSERDFTAGLADHCPPAVPPTLTLVIEMSEDEEGFMVVGRPEDHRPGTDDVDWTPPRAEQGPTSPDHDDEGNEEDDDGILIVLAHDLPELLQPRQGPIRGMEVAHG